MWKGHCRVRRQIRSSGTCHSAFLEPVALLTGAKHVPIHRGPGPADSEGLAVCGEDGEPDERPGVQVQTGGGESQATPGPAVQGTRAPPPPRPGLFPHHASPFPPEIAVGGHDEP